MPNSVEKTMQLLRALSDARGAPVSLADLSERLAIHKSTLSHILKVLVEKRYVLRVSRSEGYTLGPELYVLTRYGRFEEELITLCRPILRMLTREGGGTALLAVLKGSHKYVIDYIDGEDFFSGEERGSGRANILDDKIYRTVTGRVLLANSSRPDALAIFEELGCPTAADWPGIDGRDSFLAELERIRRMPVYYWMNPAASGNFDSWAVPLMKKGICVGALGYAIEGDSGVDPARMERLMKKCRQEAGRRLAFDPD